MRYRYNPPPNWPAPPTGWQPTADWVPPADWPPPPPGWKLWTPVRADWVKKFTLIWLAVIGGAAVATLLILSQLAGTSEAAETLGAQLGEALVSGYGILVLAVIGIPPLVARIVYERKHVQHLTR